MAQKGLTGCQVTARLAWGAPSCTAQGCRPRPTPPTPIRPAPAPCFQPTGTALARCRKSCCEEELPINVDDLIFTLTALIDTSRDGEQRFRSVAENARSTPLRVLFTRRADEYALAAADLAICVRQLGGKPDVDDPTGGALQRRRAAPLSSVAGTTDLTLLEDCERVEQMALQRYRRALENDLPEPERTLVSRQLEGVQHNHAEVRGLCERERVRAA